MGWVGNNSWMDPPFFWRHLVPQNVGNIIFVCYFLNIGLGPKKVNGLAICSKNQFRDYCIRNRLEKLVPLNWNFAPQNFKNRKTTDQLVFKPWLCWSNLGAPPRISQGFSMDFPPPPSLNFRGGRGSGRQISRPGSLGRALSCNSHDQYYFQHLSMPSCWKLSLDKLQASCVCCF